MAAYTDRLKGQVCSLAYESAATWRRPTFIQVTRVNSSNFFVTDISTIKIVLVIIIIVITIIIINVSILITNMEAHATRLTSVSLPLVHCC